MASPMETVMMARQIFKLVRRESAMLPYGIRQT